MQPVYTLGEWTVRHDREQDFIAAWSELAEWTRTNFEAAAWANLLRDRDQPGRFVSFGPWRDESAIAVWRTSPGFQARVGHIKDLVESFTPHTMELAAETGSSIPEP